MTKSKSIGVISDHTIAGSLLFEHRDHIYSFTSAGTFFCLLTTLHATLAADLVEQPSNTGANRGPLVDFRPLCALQPRQRTGSDDNTITQAIGAYLQMFPPPSTKAN